MNSLLLIAAILAILLGLAHSFLGERLIFSSWRKTPPAIPRAHRQIIWASWHVLTLLGWAMAAILLWAAQNFDQIEKLRPVLLALVIILGLSGLMVLYARRGRHPGWIVFMIIAGLIGWTLH